MKVRVRSSISTRQIMKKKPFYKNKWFIGIIIFCVLALIGKTYKNSVEHLPPMRQEENKPTTPKKRFDMDNVSDKIDLNVQAQQFVLQGLKSPSTAKFPPLTFNVDDLGNEKYKIESYVDSQNSFGAMIRSNWSVTMKLVGERWILERMIIGDMVVYDPERQKASQAEFDEELRKANEALDEAKETQKLFR